MPYTAESLNSLLPAEYELVDPSPVFSSQEIKVLMRCRKHEITASRKVRSILDGLRMKCCVNSSFIISYEEMNTRVLKKTGGKCTILQDSYQGSRSLAKIFCTVHKIVFSVEPSVFLKGRGCRQCVHGSPTLEEFELLFHESGVRLVEGSYKGKVGDVVEIVCLDHGASHQDVRAVLKGNLCKFCSIESKRVSFKDFKKRCQLIHADKYSFLEKSYTGIRNEVAAICKIHGAFSVIAAQIASGGSCPQCPGIKSKGEIRTEKFLVTTGLTYVAQWTSDDFRNPETGRRLRYDFSIPSLRVLIEYDGEGHREPIPWGAMTKEKAQELFHKVQERDVLKTKLAEENNWRLVRIENAEEINVKLAFLLKENR